LDGLESVADTIGNRGFFLAFAVVDVCPMSYSHFPFASMAAAIHCISLFISADLLEQFCDGEEQVRGKEFPSSFLFSCQRFEGPATQELAVNGSLAEEPGACKKLVGTLELAIKRKRRQTPGEGIPPGLASRERQHYSARNAWDIPGPPNDQISSLEL